ncbi:MAG TPA: hypothetical protein VIM29_12450 [Bacillota bacterium]
MYPFSRQRQPAITIRKVFCPTADSYCLSGADRHRHPDGNTDSYRYFDGYADSDTDADININVTYTKYQANAYRNSDIDSEADSDFNGRFVASPGCSLSRVVSNC